MRLLSVKEVKQKDPADGIRESRYLDKLIKEQRQTWNDVKKTIDPEKAKLEKDFLSFNQNLQIKKGQLLKEVADLEERREKALLPLDQKWYELEVKEAELKEWEININKQAKENSQEREFLMEKALFIADKSDELAQRSRQIAKQEKGIKKQELVLKKSTEDLNNQWVEFKVKIAEKELELSEHKKRNFDKEEELQIIKNSLDKEKQDLSNFKRQLDDRQQTLQRSWDELRSKNGR